MTGPLRSSSKPSDRAPIDPPTTTLSPKPYKSSKLPSTSNPKYKPTTTPSTRRQGSSSTSALPSAPPSSVSSFFAKWNRHLRTNGVETFAQPSKPSVKSIITTMCMTRPKPLLSILQTGRNTGHALVASVRRTFHFLQQANHVHFQNDISHTRFFSHEDVPSITYDSGADGHYLNEADRKAAHLPILRSSSKQVAVANGHISAATHVSRLPFPGLSKTATKADTFHDFPQSLMSVGKVSDDGTLSIFTKDGVTVHKEEDVLITCKGAPILIGVRDDHGRYRIPLTQHKGTWQPRQPSKRAKQALQQANSVYDLPSTEQAIKWMHAVCGYPVKSTWLKAIKAGNFVGWPLLTEANVKKYYPRPQKPQGAPQPNAEERQAFQESLSNQLRGKKVKDVFVNVYDVRETVFTDQTGQFPTRSQSGNKYVMVLVDIDSSGILVEPIKNRTDPELTRAYEKLLLRLKLAGIVPKKHVLDNEISTAMKDLITNKYRMAYELVPPGCHRRNAAEVAIRNFKAHFLSILAGTADDFPLRFWDKLLPQAEITINLLRQSNATPTVSAYAHLNGPFDYNKMPLAPMGCNVQVHEKTDARGTWAYHSVDGWYIGTSPEHYRTHKCHIKATNSERFSDTMLNYRQLIRHPNYNADWTLSSANEFGRLANGVGGRVKGTNTITFIPKAAVPPNRRKDVTYGTFVCTIRPEKKEPNRTRFVVGGDRINYPGSRHPYSRHAGR
eukprot:CCRYP_014211-RB/>CCRYP_014211-RB protein AED:0.26 eAED:0.26 QI:0/0/0/1/0.33/0.25/4/0/726